MVINVRETAVTKAWRPAAVIDRSRGIGTMPAMDAPAFEFVVEHLPAATRALRIACVTETYPPEVNGVATSISRIVEGLHRRDHDVQLIRPRQHANDAAIEGARFVEVLVRGLAIPRYPGLRMGLPAKKALMQRWIRERPDVVHIATEGPLGWSALQAAAALGVPVASDFRTNFHAYSRHYGIGWLARPIAAYLRKFHNRSHCTMVPTDALRRQLEADGFHRLSVVGRGVDTQGFDPRHRSAALRSAWGAGDDDLVMLYVGRLAAEKNLEALAAAHAAVRARTGQARLVIVGEGPMKNWLQERCPGALFAGQRRGADLSAHYASADLFVFPSLTETFGNVTVEAMASGLAVAAFDHAAAGQMVRAGEHGLLAPCGDQAAFVEQVLALSRDLAQCRRMGRHAHDRAVALDWRQVTAQFEAVLHQAIDLSRLEWVGDRLPLRMPA